MGELFFLLLLLLVLAVTLRLDWIYYLVYVLGGVWLFSHWWIRRSLGLVSVQRRLPRQAFTGEVVQGELLLQNRSWLPLPWLRVQEAVPLELHGAVQYRSIFNLGSRGSHTFAYELTCRQRGYYPVGPVTLRTGDLFGFVESSWVEAQPIYLTVYPRVLPLYKLGLPSRSPFGVLASYQRLYQDPNRIAGVRNYASGDSMRHIHWKASAHEDSLLVKKYQPAISLDVMVVVDLNRNAYPLRGTVSDSEWAIVIAASVCSHLSEQRQAVGLTSNGRDPISDRVAAPVPVRAGRGHLMSVLSLLARIQIHSFSLPLYEWLPAQLYDLAWGTTLILVAPQLDERSLWALHGLNRRGITVVVLLCAAQPNFTPLQSRAGKLGVTVERTLWDQDLSRLGAAEKVG